MRRVLLGAAVMALTVLAFAGPAGAASGQVTQFRFHGTFAAADWFTSSATSFTDTFINVSQSKQGSELIIDQFTAKLDANGNFIGGTDTLVDVTSGFSFAIDQARLASASTSGSGLPGETCTLAADFTEISCVPATIDVNAAWTGQGPISRSVFNDHFKSAGFSVNDHFSGTDRTATATATFGGLPQPLGELQSADLGTANSGTITLCIGNSC
jgi:hypothetical protein